MRAFGLTAQTNIFQLGLADRLSRVIFDSRACLLCRIVSIYSGSANIAFAHQRAV